MPVPIPELIAAAVEDSTLPPRPEAELDAYLDAAEQCVRRYGWSHTSPRDIARQAGVNRTTIYRVLGAKNEIFRLLVAREVYRLIDQAAHLAARVRDEGTPGADAIVELAASAIEQVRANPTLGKLIEDDPELIGGFMRDGIPAVVERFTAALGPLLGVAMQSGTVAKRDPQLATEWVVRICLSLLFAPPRGDLRAFLAAGIRPLFAVEKNHEVKTPASSARSRKRVGQRGRR